MDGGRPASPRQGCGLAVAAIVVVGGGVAGLTCAWRLRRAGHDVEVLEREAVPGGRMRSERRGEFVIERGASVIASGFRNALGVVEALGLRDRLHPLPKRDLAILRDARLYAVQPYSAVGLLRSEVLSVGARLGLRRLLLDLLRHRRHLSPWHPERAAHLDSEDLATYLRRTVGEEALEYLLGPAFAACFHAHPEWLSRAFALLTLRFFPDGLRPAALEGGMGVLTETLARRVLVRLGSEVIAVETETDGARVRYRSRGRERSVLADAAVVAVPGPQVPGLCPKLTPAERGFFERVHYTRGLVAWLMLDEAPASLPYCGVAFPRREGLNLHGLGVAHYKRGTAPLGAGLVHVTLTSAVTERLWEAPVETVAGFAVEQLAATPVGRLAPADAVVHRWSAMFPQFSAGYLRDLATFASRTDRSPRLALAGDYLVGPHIEGAVTSGMRAAAEIQSALAH